VGKGESGRRAKGGEQRSFVALLHRPGEEPHPPKYTITLISIILFEMMVILLLAMRAPEGKRHVERIHAEYDESARLMSFDGSCPNCGWQGAKITIQYPPRPDNPGWRSVDFPTEE